MYQIEPHNPYIEIGAGLTEVHCGGDLDRVWSMCINVPQERHTIGIL